MQSKNQREGKIASKYAHLTKDEATLRVQIAQFKWISVLLDWQL